MKKVLTFITILCIGLVIPMTNIKGANSCEATLVDKSFSGSRGYQITVPILNRTGTIYVAQLSGNGVSRVALCLDRGLRAGTTYIRSTTRVENATPAIRKAYALANSAYGGNLSNFNDDLRMLKYFLAQVVVWLSQEGIAPTNDNIGNITGAIVGSYYAHSTMTDEIRNKILQQLRDAWNNTQPYSGQLYTYESLTSAGTYQRFISSLNLNTCPPKEGENNPTDPTDPTNPDNPETPSCPSGGGVMKVVGSPAVCANDNKNHTGYYYEELDMSECGTANEYGEPVRKLGDYAYLYCKEEAVQNYPGGISSPLALGTSLVWPTSSKTLHTIWGNLYPLSYSGTKTCKIVLTPNTMQKENPETTLTTLLSTMNSSQYRSYDTVRQNGGNCASYYGADVQAAQNAVNDARNTVSYYQNAVNSAQADYNAKKAAADSLSNSLNSARSGQSTCVSGVESYCRTQTGGTTSGAYQACVSTRRSSVCKTVDDAVASYSRQLNAAGTAATQAGNALGAANNNLNNANNALNNANNRLAAVQKQMNDCNTYMNAYNGAIGVLNSISSVASTSFDPNDLYHFDSNTSISYDDPEYGQTYVLTGNTNYSCDGCAGSGGTTNYGLTLAPSQIMSTFRSLYQNITDRTVILEASVTYTLPDNLYYYVNKKTNKPLMNPTGDYITIGYSNLPTSYDAKVGKNYNLNIYVDSLGENGKFTEVANQTPYVCNYTLTNTTTDDCVCPEGTKHAGEDLYCKIFQASSSSTTMTCAEAQTLYCDSDETFDEYCGPDKFCPNDPSMKLTSCLNNGYSYNYCADAICNNPNVLSQDYHCPKGTFNDGMDIKPCVFANIDMGLEAALQYCKDTVCPYQGGIRIIYRTISLRNPFPGKNATGPTVDFSLDNIRGRYPGANWNSKTLVKNQILYNRGVEGNALYQKEPLYSFILDTATIKAIREYNEKRESSGGYADFTLDCKNGIACLSNKFLRESQSGLVGGVCSHASATNFYVCSES